MKYENEKRTDRVEVRIEPTLKELFGDIAFKQGISISDFVRTLMIKEIKKWTAPKRKGAKRERTGGID